MIKIFRSLACFLIAVILFISCQREESFEIGIVSTGSLKSSAGNCIGATVNGIYKEGAVITAANSIDIQVDVTGAGSYLIVSDTVNGFSFKAEGDFSKTGINTVRLLAKGTPTAATTNNFTVRYGNSTCLIPITTVGANVVPAAYTYSTAADGTCSGAIVSGDFKPGEAVDVSNSVKLAVNVTAVGTYAISIAAVNGISFSATGVFANTGVQNIILAAAGTPTATGVFNITASIANSSCTFSVAVATSTAAAVYTLGGAGSNCTGFTLAGIFASGTVMTAANTVKVQVTVTTIGSFTLSAAAVNGVSFSASGAFTTTGAQTVTLTATGTPTSSGIKTFAVNAGTVTCNFDISFAAAAAPAIFTLTGAPGVCTGFVVNGIYQVNTPLTVANTILIKVDVTAAGSYSISTNTMNGMTFSATGVFASTGNGISVTLLGSGKPTAAGSITLSPAVGNATCTVNVTVIAAPTGTYKCKIDGTLISFDNRSAAEVFDNSTGEDVPYLYLDGFSGPPNGNEVPEFQIFISMNDETTVNAGTYDEKHLIPTGGSLDGTYEIGIVYKFVNADGSVTIWSTSSNFLPPPNPPFTIIITSRTATNIKGTFSGELTNILEGRTGKKVVTEGVFDLPIQ